MNQPRHPLQRGDRDIELKLSFSDITPHRILMIGTQAAARQNQTPQRTVEEIPHLMNQTLEPRLLIDTILMARRVFSRRGRSGHAGLVAWGHHPG